MNTSVSFKAEGLVVIIGSIGFLIAAFSPISKVFGIADPMERLHIINAGSRAWFIASLFFSLGAIVTALGLLITALKLDSAREMLPLWIAVSIILIGALLWSFHIYQRTHDPQAWVTGELPHWPFILYSILTQAGLILIGITLLNGFLANWAGWMLIVGGGLFFILMVIFRDMPPFVYYILTLILGVLLMRMEELAQ